MAGSPKDIEEKIHRILTGWRTLAPERSFGGMTLAQFEAMVQPSLDARQRIDNMEEELRQAKTDRENADEVSMDKSQHVVNGVLADPDFGPDSALYGSFGYKTRRERDSGLTRPGSKKRPTE